MHTCARLTLAAACLTSPGFAGGQAVASATMPPPSHSGVPAVDSAAAARAAWARATRALRAGDAQAAMGDVARAARAWPTQPAYVWGRAVVALQLADTAGLLAALHDYADLGLGRDLHADPRLRALAGPAAFDAVARRHDEHRAPLVRSTVHAALSDSLLWPEGADHDPRTGRIYVASVRHRTVVVREPDGRERDLLPRDRAGALPVLAVRVARDGTVWATESPVAAAGAPDGVAALLRIRASDGAIERRWTLPAAAGHALGDIAIGPRGDVFVSDSDEPVLLHLRAGTDTLERLAHPLFRSLQGIAIAPDGLSLWVADYSHGLLHVDLASRTVTRLVDAPGSTSLGCDGIAYHHGAIVAVQNGVAPARVVRFTLSADGRRVVRAESIDRNVAIADEPTGGFLDGDRFVYVANSQWEKHGPEGTPRPGARLAAPVLLALPLAR